MLGGGKVLQRRRRGRDVADAGDDGAVGALEESRNEPFSDACDWEEAEEERVSVSFTCRFRGVIENKDVIGLTDLDWHQLRDMSFYAQGRCWKGHSSGR